MAATQGILRGGKFHKKIQTPVKKAAALLLRYGALYLIEGSTGPWFSLGNQLKSLICYREKVMLSLQTCLYSAICELRTYQCLITPTVGASPAGTSF